VASSPTPEYILFGTCKTGNRSDEPAVSVG